MIDLSPYPGNIEFLAESSDYNNCIDLSATTIDDIMSQPQAGSLSGNEATMLRWFLGRIDKRDIPKLIVALEDSLK